MASKLKIILTVVGIYIAGTVTGGFLSLSFVEFEVREKRNQQRASASDLSNRLVGELQLTDEQKALAKPILSSATDELRKIRRESFDRMGVLVAQVDSQITKILTPEQVVLLTEIRKKEDERRKELISDKPKKSESRAASGTESTEVPAATK